MTDKTKRCVCDLELMNDTLIKAKQFKLEQKAIIKMNEVKWDGSYVDGVNNGVLLGIQRIIKLIERQIKRETS